jgi:hypothetical protein
LLSLAPRLRTPSRGELVREALTGSWRRRPPAPTMSADTLAGLVPLLIRTGAGGLAWWRLRGSALAACPAALDLRQAYRLQALQARLHERRLVQALGILRAAGIEPLLAKGWAAARLYPEPGLRPYGDVDLWVAPYQRARAAAALSGPDGQRCRVDLHAETPLPDRRYEELHERSRLEPLGGIEVRILGPEDHLALLCVHMLGHGAWRPVWLCDIAAAVESLPSGFDWARCLPADPRRAGWIVCALGLARRLLGARVSDAVVAPLPRWLPAAVLRQWAREEHYMSTPSMAFALRRPRLIPRALRLRWPNAIQATVDLEGPFNALPRLPFQLAGCLWRLVRAARPLPGMLPHVAGIAGVTTCGR